MTSASRAARRARRPARFLGAAVAALLLAAAPVGAASAETTPTPTPAASGTATFTLAPVAGGVVRSGEPLTVLVSLRNDTAATVAAGPVRLYLGDTAFASRTDAAAWDDAPDGRALTEVGEAALDAVAPGVRQTVSISVVATDAALADRAPGVYPLLAVQGDGASARSSASTLVVAAAATTTSPVAVVVPITAPARTTGLLSADELAQATAADGTLTQQLDGVDGTGAILAVDPAIAASIRILGNTAPATATAWLERLEQLPNSRFALQFGDADVAAQLHSQHGMLLQPPSFEAQLDPTRFPATAAAGVAATPVATAAPDLPTQAELLDLGDSTRAAVYWPATGTADAAVVTALSADPTALTLVPSDTTAAGAGGATVAARGDGVLVYDSALSEALADASQLDDQLLRSAALSRVAAQFAFALPQAGGAPLLVTVDRAEGRSRVALRAVLAAVADTDGVVLDDLGDLDAATPTAVAISGGTVDAARAAAVDALVADETTLASFATMLADPRLLTAPERAAMLQTIGDGWMDDPTAWQQALAAHRAATTETLASVSVPPPTDVNLLTANTRLQFVVRNTLPWPVTVTLVTEPDDPRLVVQRATVVQAEADQDTRVVVPVAARVGNGDVTIALQLRSPTGVAIGSGDSVDVRVRAEWEGIGVVVLAVVVGGLLGLGILRTVLRRRSARKTADASASVDAKADA